MYVCVCLFVYQSEVLACAWMLDCAMVPSRSTMSPAPAAAAAPPGMGEVRKGEEGETAPPVVVVVVVVCARVGVGGWMCMCILLVWLVFFFPSIHRPIATHMHT